MASSSNHVNVIRIGNVPHEPLQGNAIGVAFGQTIELNTQRIHNPLPLIVMSAARPPPLALNPITGVLPEQIKSLSQSFPGRNRNGLNAAVAAAKSISGQSKVHTIFPS